MSATVDVNDIQALVFSGHTGLPVSLALVCTVMERERAREQLRALANGMVSFGIGGGRREEAVQLLLSAAGAAALGTGADALAPLDGAYREGIVTAQRSRALGDAERNAPGQWAWRDASVHVLLLLYAKTPAGLDDLRDRVLGALAGGWAVPFTLPICAPADEREPFGFRDGIATTRVDLGDGASVAPHVDLLPPGEVLVGHRTAAGTLTPAPALGTNGSYVVVRQLEQDVERFWQFWRGQARDDESAIWLAAKSVGRWPNGMPLLPGAAGPGAQPAAIEEIVRRRLSFESDRAGHGCPFGAHIRRANPREALGDDPVVSRGIVAQHRIVRRGRVYGAPAPAEWYPASLERPVLDAAGGHATEGRGLLFMCLCADIARQFEFIQQTWLNNPKFDDLYDEVDPTAAGEGIPSDKRRFSIQAAPLRRRIHGVRRWVTVKAGGYFLLPGRTALAEFLKEQA